MKSFAVPPNMTVEQVLEVLAPKEPAAAADEQPQPAPQPKRRSKQEP
jgi:hypothetical protein